MTEALFCLAMAIYFEARGEPMVGQVAVAQVVINRVTDYRYPDDVCAVVKEGYYYSWDKNKPIKDKCQFSFWCDGKPETINDLTSQKPITFLFLVMAKSSLYCNGSFLNFTPQAFEAWVIMFFSSIKFFDVSGCLNISFS